MKMRRVISRLVVFGALSLGTASCGLAEPVIESIVPASGAAGSHVTITGRGFEADNTIYFGGARIRHVGIASAAAIACTANPNCKSGIAQSLGFSIPRKVRNGVYRVKVKNASGVSNEITFVIEK